MEVEEAVHGLNALLKDGKIQESRDRRGAAQVSAVYY
jgi:hypothetical protein